MFGDFLLKEAYRIGCNLAPILPSAPYCWLTTRVLNQQMAASLADGDFDFLEGKILSIKVSDFRLEQRLGLHNRRFFHSSRTPHTIMTASSADFLAIADGREDPDTLFFHRRLQISGDVELGLTAKNRLDAFDRDTMSEWLRRAIHAAATGLERARGDCA